MRGLVNLKKGNTGKSQTARGESGELAGDGGFIDGLADIARAVRRAKGDLAGGGADGGADSVSTWRRDRSQPGVIDNQRRVRHGSHFSPSYVAGEAHGTHLGPNGCATCADSTYSKGTASERGSG